MSSGLDETLRERIMQHFATRFKSVARGQPYRTWDGAVGTYGRTWNAVLRRAPSKTQLQAGSILALYDTRETKVPEVGYDKCFLTVHVEFYDKLLLGDEASTILNRMLGDVQACIATDISCGGLCLNVVETKNELDIDGPAENLIAGVVEYQVVYRHRAGNPRLQK